VGSISDCTSVSAVSTTRREGGREGGREGRKGREGGWQRRVKISDDRNRLRVT